MSFLEKIENTDQKILLAINGSHNEFLDGFMFYLSEKWVFIPVYLLLLFFLQKHYGWKMTGIIVSGALLLVAACDLTATHLFKNVFMRYRPSHHLELKEQLHFVNGYHGGTYGFFSSHAANMAGLAVFCGAFLYGKVKHYAIIAFTLVALVGLSRIYLGVHYPSDIITGYLAGISYGLLFVFLLKKYILPKLNFQE